MLSLRHILILFVVLLLGQGCATFKLVELGSMAVSGPPELEYRYYNVKDVSFEGIQAELVFAAINPNKRQLDTFFVDYEFFIRDKSVVEGSAIKVNLIPSGLSKLSLPVSVKYERLFDAAGHLAELVSQGKKQIDSRVHIRIYGEYQALTWYGKPYDKMYSYEHDLDLSVPLPEITAKKVKNTLKGAVNSFMGLQVFDTGTAAPSAFRNDVQKQVVRVQALNNLAEDTSIYMDMGMEGQY